MMTIGDPKRPRLTDGDGRVATSPIRVASITRTGAAAVAFLSLWPNHNNVVDSFVVLSRHSTQLAFDASFDATSSKLITTGVLFRTAFKDITMQGSSDTDCYIAAGDARGFDRVLYETPQLCTHFEIFPVGIADGNTDPEVAPLPSGISVGMFGDQAMMGTIDFSGEYTDLPLTNPYNLPFQTFPVGVTSDADGNVYVGLHDTGGILPAVTTDDPNGDLQNVYDYYKLLTHPMLTEHLVSPQVVKVNMRTQELVWELDMETTEGRSTIGNVVHMPSRDLLVVVGSSSGKGSLVGAGEFSNSWDGYVTLVNATSGISDDSAANQTYLEADHSLRVQSQVGQDDYILGACASDDNLFIVGTTTGQFVDNGDSSASGGAFAMMLDVDTLHIQWKQQWYGSGVEAIKCFATSTFVYVAGHVPAGVSLKEDSTRTQTPSKDQDIFLSLVDTADGNVRWTRQIDSRRPDHLADIILSSGGNLIFVENAMDFTGGISDIVTATVDFVDGFYDWQGLPPEADPIQGDFNQGKGQTIPPGMFGPVEATADSEDNQTTVIVVATVVSVVFLLGVIVCVHIYQKKAQTSEETKIDEPVPETSVAAVPGGVV